MPMRPTPTRPILSLAFMKTMARRASTDWVVEVFPLAARKIRRERCRTSLDQFDGDWREWRNLFPVQKFHRVLDRRAAHARGKLRNGGGHGAFLDCFTRFGLGVESDHDDLPGLAGRRDRFRRAKRHQ